MNTPLSTKDDILNSAQELLQTRGYNGFSYADISLLVGIRKASIHHYFPSKTDLAKAVIQRYKDTFNGQLHNIEMKKNTWLDKIRAYIKLYEEVLRGNKLCLCGMLASDLDTLPDSLKSEIQKFFSDNVVWLTKILALHHTALSKKRLHQVSWQIIHSLQGGILIARTFNKPEMFASACAELLISLKHIL